MNRGFLQLVRELLSLAGMPEHQLDEDDGFVSLKLVHEGVPVAVAQPLDGEGSDEGRGDADGVFYTRVFFGPMPPAHGADGWVRLLQANLLAHDCHAPSYASDPLADEVVLQQCWPASTSAAQLYAQLRGQCASASEWPGQLDARQDPTAQEASSLAVLDAAAAAQGADPRFLSLLQGLRPGAAAPAFQVGASGLRSAWIEAALPVFLHHAPGTGCVRARCVLDIPLCEELPEALAVANGVLLAHEHRAVLGLDPLSADVAVEATFPLELPTAEIRMRVLAHARGARDFQRRLRTASADAVASAASTELHPGYA